MITIIEFVGSGPSSPVGAVCRRGGGERESTHCFVVYNRVAAQLFFLLPSFFFVLTLDFYYLFIFFYFFSLSLLSIL